MKRTFLVGFCALVFTFSGCGSSPSTSEPNCSAGSDTPTASYQRLFDAVKSKQTESIKAQMTEGTIQFANGISAQNKTPIEKVFENGFTGTTFASTMPDIRDERINCNMGAIEVWNAKDQKWEDLPFIIENGSWKFAIGELFKGSFKSPGEGLARKEAIAANAARGNVPVQPSNVNTNKIATNSIPANGANRISNRK